MSGVTIERADLGMAWAVKDSFVNYVKAMNDGRIILSDGAAVTSTRQFYFPFKHLEQSGSTSFVLHFGGEARFFAHHGFMSVLLRHPRIEVTPDSACLSIEPEQGREWLRLAELDLPAGLTEDGVTMWDSVVTKLADAGVATFGDSYRAGETLSPLTVRAPALTVAG
ncbi:HtaA domain-containing protein [Arthrobacter sp. H-02-3]|uniref:HtaA domain-containing protein n=1 Tax=Arthrobacter sp. H-02-3 TaxID=2703675 RepID=UPI000DD2979F|nr:HtaA domain-containing protein [Arthrobacter sp. H-02-3]PVZ53871.1 hypothetical protein C9424_16805 [Arthrobacter sp. H-02-3]